MSENFKIKTLSNIGYMSIAKLFSRALSAVASIVLAQNLSSSDYGIVGFATIFIGFLSQFSDLGMDSAIIQKRDLDETGLYTGFTIKLILGTIVFLLTFFLSPLVKNFFDNDAVEIVIKVLSLNFLFNSFFFLPNCLLTRELNYKRLIIPLLFSAVISSAASIILALSGFKYWSIVIASLFSSLTTMLVLNFLKPVRIKFRLDRKESSEFIHFGGNLFLSGLIIYILFNADNFIIGAAKGAGELGYYAIAFNWGSMICSILYTTMHNVLFPTFARIQDDKERLKNNYLRVLEYVSFIGILFNIILLIVAQDFLFYILGRGSDKWLPALTAFRILCIYGIIRSLLEPIANVLMALGKTNILLKSNIIVAVVELGLLYPAILYFGIEGAAIVVTIAYASQYLIYFPFLKGFLNLSYTEVWAVTKPAIISACTVVIFIAMVSEIIQRNSILFMFQKTLLSAVGFVLLYGIITKWKFIHEIKSIINEIKLNKL